jgi:outer membrane translocation and assembly module TamA
MWGGRYYYARAALLRSLSSGSVTLLGRFSLAGVLEAGQAFSKGDVVNPYSDVALGVVGETPVGAIFLGPAYGEGGEWRFAVRLGKLF